MSALRAFTSCPCGLNPLRRVPTLVTDDGEALIESAAILDWVDEQAGREKALIATSGIPRRTTLRICALASGLADKAVSLVYERVVHERATAESTFATCAVRPA